MIIYEKEGLNMEKRNEEVYVAGLMERARKAQKIADGYRSGGTSAIEMARQFYTCRAFAIWERKFGN